MAQLFDGSYNDTAWPRFESQYLLFYFFTILINKSMNITKTKFVTKHFVTAWLQCFRNLKKKARSRGLIF